MLDWRGLLDHIRVPWRDRGKNTSRGNINVCCPFCVEDNGFHLSIAEEREGYFCYRNNSHKGTNVVRLLVALGIDRASTPALINQYSTHRVQAPVVRDTEISVSSRVERWQRFALAHTLSRHAHYLRTRGFDNPERVATRFDIRAATEGIFANRILLPIKLDGKLMTWTGRAIVSTLEPKYEVEAKGDQNIPLIYVPSEADCAKAKQVIIVEGPLDALKIAAAMPQALGVTAVALGGKNLSSARLLRLRSLIPASVRKFVCLDNDAPLSEIMASMREIESVLPGVMRLRVPRQYKDAGEMSEQAVQRWLNA